MPSGDPVNYAGRRCTESHSTAIFSFKGTIKVTVTVRKGASNITLPLTSAKILPTSYNIPCQIINDSTITFTLDRPEKVVVMPNYNKSWKVFEDKAVCHVPIQNWQSSYNTEMNRPDFHGHAMHDYLTEGYKNPLLAYGAQTETAKDINKKYLRRAGILSALCFKSLQPCDHLSIP